MSDAAVPGPTGRGGEQSGDTEAPGAAPETSATTPPPDERSDGNVTGSGRKRRRRGSRGGRKRSKPRSDGAVSPDEPGGTAATATAAAAGSPNGPDDRNPELPDLHREGRPASVEAAAEALVPKASPPGAPAKPKIGDTIPVDALRPAEGPSEDSEGRPAGEGGKRRRRRRGGRGRSSAKQAADRPVEAVLAHDPVDLDEEELGRRRGRERKGRPVGRYSMVVHVTPTATQMAVLEGRALLEHYVSRPSDDVSQIHGNIYLGRVQNVLPGMEAAFVDIATPKNAVLYRGDVQYDAEDIEERGEPARIEDILRARQLIVCQVTKNPIGAKGARLTQEVSLPGRYVVLIPNSKTYGISKRLPDDVRKRLRAILDRVKPAQHGLIVRTAAEHATEAELRADMTLLLDQWNAIEAKAKKVNSPT